MRGVIFGMLLAVLVVGCGGRIVPYPLQPALWRDPDRRPFAPRPEGRFLAETWDSLDHTLTRPAARLWAVDPAGRATNVNAMDEVPSSSWYSLRLGHRALSPEDVARGPCVDAPLDEDATWTVVAGKPNGVFPGFLVEDPAGRKFLIKLDGKFRRGGQGPRATAADVIASRIYHAAGYTTPCNRIVHFDRANLSLSPDAKATTVTGAERPMTEADIDGALAKATLLPGGRFRASASQYLEGKPIGPWRYLGILDGDRNDVVPHEDRREVRAMRLLGAWVDHADHRAMNTLAMWIETGGGKGYVRHALIDFGDCFGLLWGQPPAQARRRGHTYFLDLGDMGVDFFTFGFIERPWDRRPIGDTGLVFAYFDVETFDPEGWKPTFPNPAFIRMRDEDGHWMARILAHFTDAHLEAMVRQGRLEPRLHAALVRRLVGRRDKILAQYLPRRSSLTRPEVVGEGLEAELCFDDLEARALQMATGARARAYAGRDLDALPAPSVRRPRRDRLCVQAPVPPPLAESDPPYLVVDVASRHDDAWRPAARVHLYRSGAGRPHVVALERPAD